ncbi:MAG: hypothetical protein KC427_08340 [Sulfurovum sp.]|uniref:hypothetical protein n=1 Tax=Sulfurovum sp. TaxID=1969726 RepID=UPI002867DA7D|nr:hypothetical protein [Sulfurovum sp.]MCO4846011.1 hypothetical protein [Sulfurovum sp.]
MKLKNMIKIFSIGLVVFMMVGCGDISSTNTIITTIPVSDPVSSVEWCPDPLE